MMSLCGLGPRGQTAKIYGKVKTPWNDLNHCGKGKF